MSGATSRRNPPTRALKAPSIWLLVFSLIIRRTPPFRPSLGVVNTRYKALRLSATF
jgi:hypothetical protein